MKIYSENLLAVSMTREQVIGLVVAISGLLIFSVVFTLIYHFLTKRDIKDIQNGKRDIELIDDDLRSSDPSVIKRKKAIRIVSNVFYYLLIILLVPVILFSIVSRAQGDYFMVGNKGIIAVGSGSMSFKNAFNKYVNDKEAAQTYNLDNQFDMYALLQIEKVNEASDLKLYDVIVFVNDEGKQVIHRIVEFVNDNGVLKYKTWGDANQEADTYKVSFNDIVGRYTNHKVNGLGIVVLFLNSMIGMLTLFALIYCLLMIDFFRRKTGKARIARTNLLSIIFNPEKNNTLMKGSIYYCSCCYVYENNKFVRKEDIPSGSMRKKSLDHPVWKFKNQEADIEIEYFDPIYEEKDYALMQTNTNEKNKEEIEVEHFDPILQEEDGQEDV